MAKDTFPKTGERYFIDIYALLIDSKSYCFCTHTTGELKSVTRAINTATKYCFVSEILSIDAYEISFTSLWESVFSDGCLKQNKYFT